MPEIDAESPEGEIPTHVQGHIRFENVHFRYPTRPGVRVLRDLNLTVEPGTYVALVGASGCGKSTTCVPSVLTYPQWHRVLMIMQNPTHRTVL